MNILNNNASNSFIGLITIQYTEIYTYNRNYVHLQLLQLYLKSKPHRSIIYISTHLLTTKFPGNISNVVIT